MARTFGCDRGRAYPVMEPGRTLRMRAMLMDLEEEVETGTRHIQGRSRHAVDGAAFSIQALEYGEGGGLARRVDMASRAVGLLLPLRSETSAAPAFLLELPAATGCIPEGRVA
jgi:hypothetical protein